MPIKKSAMVLLVLVVSSVSLLVFSADTIITPVKEPVQVKCCQKLKENEPISPWNVVSQSMLRTKA